MGPVLDHVIVYGVHVIKLIKQGYMWHKVFVFYMSCMHVDHYPCVRGRVITLSVYLSTLITPLNETGNFICLLWHYSLRINSIYLPLKLECNL